MVELVSAEGLVDVAELVGVDVHVVVGDEAGDELAVEEVVRGVHRAQARVRVGVAAGGRMDPIEECFWWDSSFLICYRTRIMWPS